MDAKRTAASFGGERSFTAVFNWSAFVPTAEGAAPAPAGNPRPPPAARRPPARFISGAHRGKQEALRFLIGIALQVFLELRLKRIAHGGSVFSHALLLRSFPSQKSVFAGPARRQGAPLITPCQAIPPRQIEKRCRFIEYPTPHIYDAHTPLPHLSSLGQNAVQSLLSQKNTLLVMDKAIEKAAGRWYNRDWA